ncbi:hypothetical protein F5X96DRAFT_618938 [Biscogniauxia mediterranea]|nr:hypothetical protein F5X96DRAFT_618938 [Biscogniauxia mediterranea]
MEPQMPPRPRSPRFELWDAIHECEECRIRAYIPTKLKLRLADYAKPPVPPPSDSKESHKKKKEKKGGLRKVVTLLKRPVIAIKQARDDYRQGRAMRHKLAKSRDTNRPQSWEDAWRIEVGFEDSAENPNWRGKWVMEVKDLFAMDFYRKISRRDRRWIWQNRSTTAPDPARSWPLQDAAFYVERPVW